VQFMNFISNFIHKELVNIRSGKHVMIGKTNSIKDLYSLNPNFIPAIFHGER